MGWEYLHGEKNAGTHYSHQLKIIPSSTPNVSLVLFLLPAKISQYLCPTCTDKARTGLYSSLCIPGAPNHQQKGGILLTVLLTSILTFPTPPNTTPVPSIHTLSTFWHSKATVKQQPSIRFLQVSNSYLDKETNKPKQQRSSSIYHRGCLQASTLQPPGSTKDACIFCLKGF